MPGERLINFFSKNIIFEDVLVNCADGLEAPALQSVVLFWRSRGYAWQEMYGVGEQLRPWKSGQASVVTPGGQ